MGQLILILFPILIADILNPVLLAGTIFSLGSKHPLINSLAVLTSYLTTYFLAGVLIAVGLEQFENVFHIPQGFDYILELMVAALLFYIAWDTYKKGDSHPEKKLRRDENLGLMGSLALGAQINLVGLPFAVPYLAAIDQILKAEINVPVTLTVLLLYNIAYVFPYFLLIPLRIIYRKESDAIFDSINDWMHRVTTQYLPGILVALGLLLVEDAVSYLIGYREYSFLSLFNS